MNKKSLFLCLLSLVLVFAVVGCGSSNTANDKEGASSSANQPTNDNPATAGPAADEKVEIDFWAWAPNDAEWVETEKAFNEKYPNIKVNYTRYSSQEYAEKIKIAIAGSSAPDAMGFELSSASKYASILEPLAPYAEKAWGADWKGLFNEAPLKQVEAIDYKLLPTGVAVTPVIVYDADLFDKVQVQPPQTLEELKAVLKKFEEAKLDGVIPRLGFPGGKASSFNDLYFNIVNQIAPNKLYEAADGKIKFTDPDIVKATEIFNSLYTDQIVQDGNLTLTFSPQLTDMFFKGKKFPMIVVGAWTLNWITQFQDQGGNYGIIPFPSINGAERSVQVNADLPLGMNKDSKHKDAVWKFIEFMTTGKYQEIESKSLLFLPVKKGLKADTSLLKSDIAKKGADLVVDMSENHAAGTRFLAYPELTESIYLNVQKVATKALTAQKAMEEIQKVSDSIKR